MMMCKMIAPKTTSSLTTGVSNTKSTTSKFIMTTAEEPAEAEKCCKEYDYLSYNPSLCMMMCKMFAAPTTPSPIATTISISTTTTTSTTTSSTTTTSITSTST